MGIVEENQEYNLEKIIYERYAELMGHYLDSEDIIAMIILKELKKIIIAKENNIAVSDIDYGKIRKELKDNLDDYSRAY